MGNKTKIAIGLLFLSTFFWRCDKGQPFDTTGEVATETRTIDFAKGIIMYDDVNVILTDKIDKKEIVVSAGKNIIKKINAVVKDSVLIIRNNNKWNWTRDLNPEINVWVNDEGIEHILHASVGALTNEGVFSFKDFSLALLNGNGIINLNVDGFYMGVYTHNSYTDIIINGYSQYFNLILYSYAPVDCRNMNCYGFYVKNNSIQDCWVHSDYYLYPTITSSGNIYYQGNPEIRDYVNTGTGSLINLEDH
ncbi:MAG: DUF2807 domain-containing protein [Bacteroidales bacterium]|nr:DUF2807 domain-containing protein [Bacteroidales bacterium]